LLVGVVCHFVLLPLVCYLMVQVFGITAMLENMRKLGSL